MNVGSLSIRTRILTTLLVLAGSLIVVGALGLYGMHGAVEHLDDMYERRVLVMSELGDLKERELERETLVAMTVLADSPEVVAKFKAARILARDEAERL